MKRFFQFSVLVVGSLSLVGCSYFGGEEEALNLDKPAVEQKIDLTNKGYDQNIDHDIKLVAKAQPITESGFQPRLSSSSTSPDEMDTSVELYPLNGATPVSSVIPSPTPTMQPAMAGADGAIPVDIVPAIPVDAAPPSLRYSNDSSVEVYPLGQEMPRPAQAVSFMPMSTMNVANINTGVPHVVYFDHNSVRLDSGDEEVISSVVNSGVSRPIAVEGYASTQSTIPDPIERKLANLKVSMERAFSVARALIAGGIPSEFITMVAHGENNPGATTEQSRRVEIRGL